MLKICSLCLAVLLLAARWSAPRPFYTVAPAQEGAEAFLEALGADAPGLYEDDRCREVTPPGLYKETGYRLFKFESSCASYLFFEGRVWQLGEWFGGSGLDSAAAADLDGDGLAELMFSYSWGSGIYHAQLGYFDPAAAEVTVRTLDFVSEQPLLVTPSGTVYYAAYDPADDAVFGALCAQAPAGQLRWEDGVMIFEEAL